MRILLWYAHGSYVNALVRGEHEYLFLDVDPSGAGAPDPTVPWPASASVVGVAELAADPPDLVVCQRLEEIDACGRLIGRTPGRDLPAVFIEHNTPADGVPTSAHPLADRPGWLIVHVTRFNALLWDCGSTATVVVDHGVLDPGRLWSGDRGRAAFVVNEPVRRWRVTGTDLLPAVLGHHGVDAFGIDGDRLPAALPGTDVTFGGNFGPEELHAEIAHNGVYLHLNRWTSLGLSLLEAMHLGMPAVVLQTTEAATLPAEIGAVSLDLDKLRRRTSELLADPDEAARCGRVAREIALERYSLAPFLTRWDDAYARASALPVGRL